MNRALRKLSVLLPCLLMLIAMVMSSAAQDFRATITGRVTDAAQSPIPNAQVVVKNIGTNEETKATTDNAGNYRVPFLRPGAYSLSVEVSGFKKALRDKIELVISQVATIDIALEPGNITEQVT